MVVNVKIFKKDLALNQDKLIIIYKSYIRSVLEYAEGLPCKQADDLERIQRRACKTILGQQYNYYSDSIIQCNINKLSDRLDHCLTLAEGLGDYP